MLDVSPSMRLKDAGPDARPEPRGARRRTSSESFFQRVPVEQYLISVVACYNGAKPVVVGTKDMEVVRNIFDDLPMHYAFPAGKTDLFSGLAEAAKIAQPWRPKSTLLVMLTDGDTVPATGMPKMPASIADVLIVGVGDPRVGHVHRRPAVAPGRPHAPPDRRPARRHLPRRQREAPAAPTSCAADRSSPARAAFERLTRREYALIACGLGSLVLAVLPAPAPPLRHPLAARRPDRRIGARQAIVGRDGIRTCRSGSRSGRLFAGLRANRGRRRRPWTRRVTTMRRLALLGWLLLPVLAGAYHYGPGQERLRLDDAAARPGRRRPASRRGPSDAAVTAYEEALARLPEGHQARGPPRPGRARQGDDARPAAPRGQRRPQGPRRGDAGRQGRRPESSTTPARRSPVAVLLTWLMKLEGLGREDWEPEIEGARQTYRLLAEQAEAARRRGRPPASAARTSRAPSASP